MASHRMRTSITWGKRLVLTLLILGAAVYGVLSLAERSEDSIRLGLQDYLSRATGHEAEITDLVKPQLTPNIAFHMKGIVIRDKENRDKALAKAETAYIALPLWRVMAGVPRYLAFEVRNLELATGFLTPAKMTVGFAGISDPLPETKPAQFLVEGRYNDREMLLTAELERNRARRHYQYHLGGVFSFTFKLGGIEGTGFYHRRMTDALLDHVVLTRDGSELAMTVTLTGDEAAPATAEGTINGVGFNARLTKTGDDRVLTITPAAADEKDFQTIQTFVLAVAQDLALTDAETSGLRLAVEPKTNIELQEQKTE